MSQTEVSRILVLVPTYNTGPRLQRTIAELLPQSENLWVVVDGSDDGSDEALREWEEQFDEDRFRVIRFEENRGKGCALLAGSKIALEEGFTHILAIDADGQHPADQIPEYIDISSKNPAAMVLGQPVFDETAPRIRVHGRKAANLLAAIEVMGGGVGDALFGMRIYPLEPFVRIMSSLMPRGATRYDFDPEIAVRLVWDGVPSIKLPTPVRYFDESEDGVSHYHYWRDNIRMAQMHGLRLLPAAIIRVPMMWWRRLFG